MLAVRQADANTKVTNMRSIDFEKEQECINIHMELVNAGEAPYKRKVCFNYENVKPNENEECSFEELRALHYYPRYLKQAQNEIAKLKRE